MARIGILGVAHLHVDAYIENLRAAGADVVGVHDRDPERGQRWAADNGLTHFRTAGELLSQGIDGVVVCAETAYHRELVEQAAAAGAAVLCEKPLGVSHEDSDAIVNACERAGVSLMTAFPVRFSPAVRQIRDMVAAGDLGALRAFSGTNQSVMPIHERSWFVDPALAGGGAMMDHIVHLADIFTWMVGAAPTEVYAVGNRIVHAEMVTVETAGLVMLTYPNGVFASIDCSWDRPFNYPSWGGIALSVVADGGTVDVDPLNQQLTRFGGSPAYGWIPWGLDTNQFMIDEFLAAIDERRQPSVTGRDGLIATKIALAAMESAATGAPVTLAD
ncbi:Gfo/Idh/MocA family oxidoreductase [Planosporangium thailandense]|uniref:Gfo/Idh/MocA family oxidoreductase n=1 Tax=Planosporangium thailandense TaxID=765197 RepID=A0ABX0XVB1_9ACTN|nr:Gfo/Idh/MocA family oxidoreductase [Planosporangium thailandense]NJC69976.1 Gfo/Idh/MocA family oxidoreductase [Planosporangium thailandense]